MALQEVSFYNTNGDEVNLTNLVSQMINFFDLKLEVGETRLTDFNEGSEIRNLLEAFAIGLYAYLEEQSEATRIAFISTSYGTYLDRIGELPFINLPRIEGNPAQGNVTFTLATAQADDYTIPVDTVVAVSETGLQFVTTSDCTIYAGETEGDASVECLTDGADGNVQAEAIDTIGAGVDTELVSVSNESALEEGTDYEEDDEYRSRLLENVQSDGFGTAGWYVHLCESVDGVHDVLLVSDNDYTRKVLVNGDVKETPASVLLEVLTKLSAIDNKVLSHTFTIDKPAYTGVSLAITLNVTTEISETSLGNMMNALFDGGGFDRMDYSGLDINQSISKDEIVNSLRVFDNIVSVSSVKQSGTEITTLTPASNGVLKLNSVSFTQNVV